MGRKDLKEIYVKKETHQKLKEMCGNAPIGKFIELLIQNKKEEIGELVSKRNGEICTQYENLFFDLNKIIGLYISIISNSSVLFGEPLKNSVVSHIKQILDTESNKIGEILKNVDYYDQFDSEFHKGILDLSTKYRRLVVAKTSVTFEEEEIISRYLFQKNKIYSGITFNPIEFYKDRVFYLKLHERLLVQSNHATRGRRGTDYHNCRIVLTDLDDLRDKMYPNKNNKNNNKKLNHENLLNLWLFIKWHRDHQVNLYFVPIDFARNAFQKHSSTLWTMKMGIFFKDHILLMGPEGSVRNRMERDIQIANSDSDEYAAGVEFLSELYDNREDFETVIHKEIPESNLDSLDLNKLSSNK
ncbi:MAG: hypothetical protein H0X50_09150 [Nitrosopumilus sp.]|nr:hypothetical protein [Nitrosopumilus sp.]